MAASARLPLHIGTCTTIRAHVTPNPTNALPVILFHCIAMQLGG
jgi:hypothetical protein